jgi:hypothetical protein
MRGATPYLSNLRDLNSIDDISRKFKFIIFFFRHLQM